MRRKNQINQPPLTGEFFDAVYNENAQKVKRMLKGQEVDVNSRDMRNPLQPTALLVAAEKQNLEMVKILLRAKPKAADVNFENKKGQRPIWWAAKYGNKELAEMVLFDGKQECDVNYLDKETGCTPLYRAILSNSGPVSRLLIHAGADVNLRRLGVNAAAETPLIKAVQLDNLEICDVLTNSLCNIHAKTDVGMTALHYAVAYRRYAITEFLLQNRIKVAAKTYSGVTAITIAIEQYNPAMAKMLIEFGYPIDKAFDWGETPLEMAIRVHSEECAMTLVQWGCSLEPPTGKPSYFLFAAQESMTNLLKLMIDINPYFLNEPWVKKKEIPLALYKLPEFCSWLFELAKHPAPMRALCISKIYKYLGKYACSKISKLPLPEKLKSMFRMESHFKTTMYREKTLYTDECPYDCPPDCEKPQCPELDFTSSSADEEVDST